MVACAINGDINISSVLPIMAVTIAGTGGSVSLRLRGSILRILILILRCLVCGNVCALPASSAIRVWLVNVIAW